MTTSLFSNYYLNDINQTNNSNKFNNFQLKNGWYPCASGGQLYFIVPNYLYNPPWSLPNSKLIDYSMDKIVFSASVTYL